MRITILFLLVFPPLFCGAQEEDTVVWQSGILTRENWQHADKFRASFGIMVAERTWRDAGGTRHKHFVAEAYWLKAQSALPNDSAQYRQLAQLLFDVYEVETRIFQQQVNNDKDDWEFLQQAYIDRANRKGAEIIKNSSNGANALAMEQYTTELAEQLERIRRENEPHLEPTGLTAVLQANATAIATSGDFRKVVPSMYGYGAGLDLGYRSVLLSVAHSRGHSNISDSLVVKDFGFYQGNRVQFRQWWLQLGYVFLPYRRLHFSVYAGINTFRFINLSKAEGSLQARGPIAVNFSAAAQVNYSFPPFSHENDGETQLELFLRLGYSRYNYLKELPGSGISAQLGLQLHIQTLEYPKSTFD